MYATYTKCTDPIHACLHVCRNGWLQLRHDAHGAHEEWLDLVDLHSAEIRKLGLCSAKTKATLQPAYARSVHSSRSSEHLRASSLAALHASLSAMTVPDRSLAYRQMRWRKVRVVSWLSEQEMTYMSRRILATSAKRNGSWLNSGRDVS
jgi:hypothetical protein